MSPHTRYLTPPRYLGLLGVAFTTLTLLGCRGSGGSVLSGNADQFLRAQISNHGLTGNPMTGRTVPAPDSALAKLGARLFFSKSLGGDRDSACVSCHHPLLGGGDALSLSIGVEATEPDRLGPGRRHDPSAHDFDGGPTVPRNAPTTFNLLAYDKDLFHDGRLESLMKTKGAHGSIGGIRTPDVLFGTPDPNAGADLTIAQARFPVTSPEEMKGHNNGALDNQQIRDYLASRIGGYGAGAGELANTAYWLQLFRDAFGNPTGTATALITEKNIARALAEYELSQVLVENPWKRYIEGDTTALSPLAKQGAILFYGPTSRGGAGCASCHSGDFFTDENFHNIGMPQIGRGKGDGASGAEDHGRFRETGNPDDRFAFRTPSLLNVEMTGPWGHTGAYTSLEAVVRHHLDPIKAVAAYDPDQVTQHAVQNLDMSRTQPALAALVEARALGRPTITDLPYGDFEVAALVAFLEALTDPCTKSRDCMSKWIPDPVVGVDPNGDHLDATLPPGVP